MYIHKYYIHNIYEYYIYVCQCVSKSFASTTYLLIHLHLQLHKSIAISLIPTPRSAKTTHGEGAHPNRSLPLLGGGLPTQAIWDGQAKRKGNFQPTWGKIWMKRCPVVGMNWGTPKKSTHKSLDQSFGRIVHYKVYRGVSNNVNSLKF